jgi:hypothetical protein
MSGTTLLQEPWYQQCRLDIIGWLNRTYGREYRFNACFAVRNVQIEEWIVFTDTGRINVLFKIEHSEQNRKGVITIYTKVDTMDFFIIKK